MKRSLSRLMTITLAAASVLSVPGWVLAADSTAKTTSTAAGKAAASQTVTAAAAETAEAGALNSTAPLQVTQTRRTRLQTPAATLVLTPEDFKRGGYKSVVEALEDCPGITISRPGYGDGEQRILINGDSRVVVLMDGRRLNIEMGASAGNGNFDASTIPDPELIAKIEIIKGASGSMYGAGAVGGVVNIITKRADGNYVKLDGAVGQLQTYKYHGTLSAKRGKYGLLITGGTYHQKDMRYKDYGSGETETFDSTKWELDSFGVKLDREIGDDRLLTLHYQHSFKEGRTPESVLYPIVGKELELLSNNISLRYDWNKDKPNAGYALLYHTYLTGRNKFPYGFSYSYGFNYSDTYVTNENRNGLDLQQNFALSPKNTLAVGASWRHVAIDDDLFSDGEKRSIDNKALFLSDAWNFTKDFSLTSGLRYDHYNTVGGKTTASLGLNKQLDASSHLYANWGTVFNVPSSSMLYSNGFMPYGYSGFSYHDNPDLRPETGYTWSIGYGKQFDAKTDLNLYYFQSHLNDALVWTNDNGYFNTFETFNANSEKKQGIVLDLSHKFSDRWKGTFSYSYTSINYDFGLEPPFTIEDFNLHLYPHQFKLGLDYTLSKLKAGLRIRAAAGGDTNDNNSNWGSCFANKSYLTMDLALNYQFNKDWTVYGKIYNLTNAAYAEQSGVDSGTNMYPMPSRYFVVGLQYLF